MVWLMLSGSGCVETTPSVVESSTLPSTTRPPAKPIVQPKPTKQAQVTSNCDTNYSGCVPIASDVDCAGGSGNGPEYVRGPVRVVGSDIYDLDRDSDGLGCE